MELRPHESQKLGECAIAVSGTTMSRSMETVCSCSRNTATIVLPWTIKRVVNVVLYDQNPLRAAVGSGGLEALRSDGHWRWGGAFGGSAVRRVVLPRTLKALGTYTFANCGNLERLRLPDCLERLGDGCFAGSGLRSIRVPAGVTEIPDSAFCDCENLETVSFGRNSRLETIG